MKGVLDGILAIDKPLGWTSHDVVAKVRRVAGQRQIGHAGTLDPLASGVLLLTLGQATRLSAYLMDSAKTYCAEVVLGATTVTDDAEAPLRQAADIGSLDRAAVERCLRRFVGEIEQVPPAYSAVRQSGKKLYQLARQGTEVQPAPRPVRIEDLALESWDPPRLRLRIICSAGTYIRALARDIGETLGVGGYLHALRRVASGSFTLEDCTPLAELTDRAAVEHRLAPPDRAVWEWPALVLEALDVARVRNGQSIPWSGNAAAGQPESDARHARTTPRRGVRLYGPEGDLVALGEPGGDRVKPFRVFAFGGGSDAHAH